MNTIHRNTLMLASTLAMTLTGTVASASAMLTESGANPTASTTQQSAETHAAATPLIKAKTKHHKAHSVQEKAAADNTAAPPAEKK